MRSLIAATAAISVGAAIPSPGRITRTADMTEVRASHTMTVLRDGRVLITGGFAGSGTEDSPLRTTELFDPRTEKFAKGSPMMHGRSGHTATLLADGRVLIVGGWTDGSESFGRSELFDPSGSRASVAVPDGIPRAGHTATLLKDGRVLLTGGVTRAGEELASSELFDPRTGSLTLAGPMSVTRAAHTATQLADGRVAIIGGGDGRYPSMRIHRTVEIFDPNTGRFTEAGEISVPRHKHAAILLAGSRVLVLGGSDNRDWRGRYASAEIYDAATGRSTPTREMGARRFKLSDGVVALSPDRVLVAGGGTAGEIFETKYGGFFGVAGSLGEARFYQAAALLGDGRVLISGGYSEGRTLPATREAFLYDHNH